VGDFPGDICELFADLFESVYNVDTCDSSDGPSDGCGFGGIRLRVTNLEAAMSGLQMMAFLLLLLNSAPMG
jgi:hypothetical protein